MLVWRLLRSGISLFLARDHAGIDERDRDEASLFEDDLWVVEET
jgi:hypothetical protein